MKNTGFAATRRRRIRLALFLAGLAGLMLIMGLALYRGAELFKERVNTSAKSVSISEYWNDGHYAEVADLALDHLERRPMDRDALLYAGYAYYFLAISRLSTQDRVRDIDTAIGYLRRLRVRGDTPHPAQVDYLLGKAYLEKGVYWADLAIAYLQASEDSGYVADDSYEFLGRAYSSIGDLEKAVEWYEKAAQTNPTDRLLIALGEHSFLLRRYDAAARYYARAVEISRDDDLKKTGLSQLGQLYYDVGNYTEARMILEQLVTMENSNPDYHFLLAETYHALQMDEEARKNWHITVRKNPRHTGALRRLYD